MYAEIEEIFSNFRNGSKPPEENFRDWLDSYVHKSEQPPPFGPYAGSLYTYRPPNVILNLDGIYQANKITSGPYKIEDWTKIWDRPTNGQAEITDYIVSIKKGLLPKEPVDFFVGTYVDLQGNNFTGVEGKRYALGGQKNKPENGIYTYTNGSFVPTESNSFFNEYGPGSLFLDKRMGNLWFKPTTRNNSNVVDSQTGQRPSEGFDFYRLDKSMLDISILDAFPMAGIARKNPGNGNQYLAIYPRLLPDPFIDHMVINYSKSDAFLSGNTFALDAESLNGFGFAIESLDEVEPEGRMDWTARLSDAYMKDLILQYLTPEPSGGYYGSSGPSLGTNKILFSANPISENDLNLKVLGGQVTNYSLVENLVCFDFNGTFVLAESAFEGNTDIVSFESPQCTEIQANSFKNSSLTEINCVSVILIETQALLGCSNLTVAVFPNVVTLGLKAFYGCGQLPEITLPSLLSILPSTFGECGSLALIDAPNATSFSGSAIDSPVANCNSLVALNLPICTVLGNNGDNASGIFDSLPNGGKSMTISAVLEDLVGGNGPHPDLLTWISLGGTVTYV